MSDDVSLAIDAMGGDAGASIAVPATLLALSEHPTLRVFVVGDQSVIDPLLAHASHDVRSRITVVHTAEAVTMSDSPSLALRTKKRSSMRLTIELVRDRQAQGCVSAGNTGALMAISGYCLHTIESIERPAIIARLPRNDGYTLMLDAGANVEANSERLFQFGQMGAAVARVLGNDAPRIGLLNVGAEENKGSDRIRAANELLREDPRLRYVGYVEGHDLFGDRVDVVVCDGFSGNVVLKSVEGMAHYLMSQLTRSGASRWYERVLAWLIKPWVKKIFSRLDPGRFNGASLVGVKGVVVKSHGAAGVQDYLQAIHLAVEEVHRDLPAAIEQWLDGE